MLLPVLLVCCVAKVLVSPIIAPISHVQSINSVHTAAIVAYLVTVRKLRSVELTGAKRIFAVGYRVPMGNSVARVFVMQLARIMRAAMVGSAYWVKAAGMIIVPP
jgi:hypothetical protein